MKILITGEKSYVGINLKKWLIQFPDKYTVDFISLRNDNWKEVDFSVYDVLFHAAALVHLKEHLDMESSYMKVNRDLTIELADKAKRSGINHFIFMSTISVYGLSGNVGKELVIDKYTPCNPTTLYGKSKLKAEIELSKLNDENFKVAIMRAPMIYGPNCPGNYARLRKLVKQIPIFPNINNKRSMIFIDNLSEFIRLIIENKDFGLFFPQNKEFVDTTELVKLISKENSKKIYFSRVLAFGIFQLRKQINIVDKVFGNLVIDSNLSNYLNFNYCVADLAKSVVICESKDKEKVLL